MELKDSHLRQIASVYDGTPTDLGVTYLGLTGVEVGHAIETQTRRIDMIWQVLLLWKGKKGTETTDAVYVESLYTALVRDPKIPNKDLTRILGISGTEAASSLLPSSSQGTTTIATACSKADTVEDRKLENKDIRKLARKLQPQITEALEKDFGYDLGLEEYEIVECLSKSNRVDRIEALLQKWRKKESNPTKTRLKEILKQSDDISNDFIDNEF